MDRVQGIDVEHDRFVRLVRRDGDDLQGIVAALGTKWMLIHRVWDLRLEGLSAVRIRDIKRVEVDRGWNDVVVRSLRERGIFPQPVNQLDLGSTGAMVVSLQRHHDIITIHPERLGSTVCHVGTICSVEPAAKTVSLLELSPSAEWDVLPTVWRFRDITRVDVADQYASALYSLAGHPVACE